jgi:hypothetical protein
MHCAFMWQSLRSQKIIGTLYWPWWIAGLRKELCKDGLKELAS